MRNVFVCLTLSFIFLASVTTAPAIAGSLQQALTPERRAIENHAQNLDELFSLLKRQRGQAESARIADRINRTLSNSGSASVDLMIGWSAKALEHKNYQQSLDFLDQVAVLRPDFADVFYRRALVHFAMQNYRKAMRDIEKTIDLEPRHVGALNSLARIMRDTGRDELALRAYEKVLSIYPALRSAQDEAARIADKLAGERA